MKVSVLLETQKIGQVWSEKCLSPVLEPVEFEMIVLRYMDVALGRDT